MFCNRYGGWELKDVFDKTAYQIRQLSNAIYDATYIPSLDKKKDDSGLSSDFPQQSQKKPLSSKEILTARKQSAHLLGKRGIKANRNLLRRNRLDDIPQIRNKSPNINNNISGHRPAAKGKGFNSVNELLNTVYTGDSSVNSIKMTDKLKKLLNKRQK